MVHNTAQDKDILRVTRKNCGTEEMIRIERRYDLAILRKLRGIGA